MTLVWGGWYVIVEGDTRGFTGGASPSTGSTDTVRAETTIVSGMGTVDAVTFMGVNDLGLLCVLRIGDRGVEGESGLLILPLVGERGGVLI